MRKILSIPDTNPSSRLNMNPQSWTSVFYLSNTYMPSSYVPYVLFFNLMFLKTSDENGMVFTCSQVPIRQFGEYVESSRSWDFDPRHVNVDSFPPYSSKTFTLVLFYLFSFHSSYVMFCPSDEEVCEKPSNKVMLCGK